MLYDGGLVVEASDEARVKRLIIVMIMKKFADYKLLFIKGFIREIYLCIWIYERLCVITP